jgi:hypothetical protein
MKKSLVAGITLFIGLALPAMAMAAIDCMSCHGSTGVKYPLAGAKLGYEASGHATIGNSRYANATGCQRCHTNEGYIQYVAMGFDTAKFENFALPPKGADGKAPPVPFIKYPSQPGCFTCHDSHTTGDFSLRTQKVDPKTKAVTNQKITLYNKAVYDGGAGNLCASCHQARGDSKEAVPASKGAFSPRGVHHHGPVADMVAGTNGWEFAGKKYSNSPHYAMVKDTCVACHMDQPKGRYNLSPEVGGHSFALAGNINEAELGNVNNCVKCHPGVKTVPAKKYIDTGFVLKNTVYFTIKAKADYDGDGTVEFVQAEVQGLLDKLVNKNGTGVMQTMANPMFKADGSFAANSKAVYTNDQLGAYANLLYVIEDKSLGAHNTTYAIQLLFDSLQALDPKFDVSKRP